VHSQQYQSPYASHDTSAWFKKENKRVIVGRGPIISILHRSTQKVKPEVATKSVEPINRKKSSDFAHKGKLD
jgi:hypothetical protein